MKTNKSILSMAFVVGATLAITSCSTNLEEQFKNITLTQGYKPQTEHNPIATQRFGADPYAMEYNGRVYVYMTNDILVKDENGNYKENDFKTINKIFCVSSEDLVNWTDHGPMQIAGVDGPAKWATFSWAPSVCHKTIDGKEKFFLYFANSGNGIGVVTSDNPYGPWTDPIGKEIVSRQTPTCDSIGVTWLFDPAVLIDDNGDGYLYVGGGIPFVKGKGPQFADPGTARVVKLDASFTALDGDPVKINPPYMFEDAGANKIGDTYYYSYCTNFNSPELGNGCIAYMTSKNPMGPFEFQRVFFKSIDTFWGIGGNNHHAMLKFNDKYYLFYHSQVLQQAMGIDHGGYRCTHVDEVNIDENGVIQDVTGTKTGFEQLKAFNPFNLTEAETMAWMAGIDTKYEENSNNMYVTSISAGDWIGLSGVDFEDGASKFSAIVSNSADTSCAIKICIDKVDGDCIGYLEVKKSDGKFVEYSSNLNKTITGKHDLFFIFSGEFEFDKWQFAK
ncbi:MAG: glycoside hydrolase family 43 protein [Bacteroidales bacterium]|nr:glycoside hydrolase family 43 protein [Bacteroidales bacterium]